MPAAAKRKVTQPTKRRSTRKIAAVTAARSRKAAATEKPEPFVGAAMKLGSAIRDLNEAESRRVGLLVGPGNYRRIARGSHLAPQHVSRVLRGLTGVSFEAAVRIADAAGLSLDELRKHLDSVKPTPAATVAAPSEAATID